MNLAFLSGQLGAMILVLMGALGVPLAATGQQISIETAGTGDLVTVTASAELQVDPRTVWAVISDYEHLADFIPDMRSSRVTRRDGDQLLLEQTGVFGFLLFQRQVEVTLAVVETPQRRIVAHAVGGNLKQMDGRYELESLPTGATRLSYIGRLVPKFAVPPIVGNIVVRRVLARQFNAMVTEILRRDALVPGEPFKRPGQP